MKIGELAAKTQTAVETIRYYEREGLLPKAPRTDGNYRLYGDEHVERLRFVRHCRSLDMTLDEVRVLLRCRDEPQAVCAEVNDLVDAHISHVAVRIKELRALEKQLRTLRDHCRDARESQHCGILRQLTKTAPASNRPRVASHRGL